MRIVVDTNELLRMASAWSAPVSPLLEAWRNGRYELALSDPLLAEFEAVAARPNVRRFLPMVNAREFVSFARMWAICVTPADEFPRCRDPKDDVVIATAVAAQAEFIVTNDSDLYDDSLLAARLRDECNLRVVRPAEFLEVIRDH